MSKKSVRNQKPQQPPKTKEQIAQDIKTAQEATRLRDLTRGKIWGMISNASKSISGASQFVQVLKMTCQQAFQRQMLDQKIGDLKINEKIDPKAPQADYAIEFMDLMSKETVATTVGLLEGIENEIQRLLRKEQASRPFTTLETDFIENEKDTTKENKPN